MRSVLNQMIRWLSKHIPFFKQIHNKANHLTQGKAGHVAKQAVDNIQISKTARDISQLEIAWSNAFRHHDKGQARVINNEQNTFTKTFVDLFLTWQQPEQQMVCYHVVIGWKGWPDRFFDANDPMFNPAYLDAFWNNELNTIKKATFQSDQVSSRCIIFPADKEKNAFRHLKLIGQDGQGNLHDIYHVVFASQEKRQEKSLGQVDEHVIAQAPHIKVPGSLEKSQLEANLTDESK